MSQNPKEKMVVVKKSQKFWTATVGVSSLLLGGVIGASLASGNQVQNAAATNSNKQLAQNADSKSNQQDSKKNGQAQGNAENGMPPMDGQGGPGGPGGFNGRAGNPSSQQDGPDTYGPGGGYGQNGDRSMPPQGQDGQGFANQDIGKEGGRMQGGPQDGGFSKGQKKSKTKPTNADGTSKSDKNTNNS